MSPDIDRDDIRNLADEPVQSLADYDGNPFGPAPTGWRAAPDCARCKDTGRFTEQGVNAHCGCKRGRKMSELWYAEKHGLYHPDEPEPSEPDWEYEGGGER